MTSTRLTLSGLLAALLMLPLSGRASDIDIYSNITGLAGNPNLLIVFDNAANFSSSAAAGAGTCQLTNTATGVTTTNSLAGTVGGIEQCAFYKVLAALPVNPDGTARVNVGFMVYNSSGITDANGANCNGSNGGCLVYPLAPMAGATRTALLNWITTWKTSNAGPGTYWIKASGEATAATMQEAWAYYAGQSGLSGRNYLTIQPAAGCQKNFVVFIGNSYSSAGSPGDGGSASPATALTTAYGATPIPTPMPILGSLNTSCGSFSFPSGNSHVTGGFYADEWARFMYNTDIFPGTTGVQNIITYTVGVISTSCQASYAALLTSMAVWGGGKYFPTSNDTDIVQALLQILNEIQAVNSVFSAATLPVSVNTQGSFLNQIYMGMFRPDQQGLPRWKGNVKQYQFQLDANGNLYLADATGQPAISSSGTGFISPNAASFWTCAKSTNLAGPVGYIPYASLPPCTNDLSTSTATGFWVNDPTMLNSVGVAADLPDGEKVEKGGVGQQIRLANLYDDYVLAPTSPRNVYTWCVNDPNNVAGTCVASLLDPTNQFATTNALITANLFGTGLNLNVTMLTRVGTTATATTAGNHGLTVGTTITISNATAPEYNGTVTITGVPAPNKFTYTVVEYPPSPATTTTTAGVGGYVATAVSTTGYPLSSLSRAIAGTAATATVTAVTSGVTPITNGTNVTISGATPVNYNLTQAVTGVVTTATNTTFNYSVAVNPTPTPVGSYVITLSNTKSTSIAGATCNASTKVVTVTTATSIVGIINTGDMITIIGDTQTPISKQMNGTYGNVTVTGASTFTYAAASCPGTPIGASVVPGPASPLSVTLTRNEKSVGSAVATGTLTASGQFANGDVVNITAAPGTTTPANETGYLATSATISCATNPCGTQFTYTIVTAPGAPGASTTMTASPALPGQTISSLTRGAPGSTTEATATVTLAPGSAGYFDQSTIAIQTAPGTTLAAHEGAYLGNWVITCSPAVAVGTTCTSFTYGALTLTPATPDPSNTITATNPGITPDRTSLINWVRGQDNYGDELGPGAPVTIRPSVHADTLHSRPLAVNYGGTTGVVLYYGTNDGYFHAVNGNQSTSIGTVRPGAELWGFIAPDFFPKLNRQRTNSPALLMPSTIPGLVPTPQPKDYFFDGPSGSYQTRDANGNITRAIVYVAARRGGHFLYAMDVTNPLSPFVLWRISNSTPGFAELGQTWSLPQVATVHGYPNPLLFFGAGYDDGAEDAEPPTQDNVGRGIFVVDALTGTLVWASQPSTYYNSTNSTGAWYNTYWTRANGTTTLTPEHCTPTAVTLGGISFYQTVCQENGMTYSIAADLSLVDRDYDGYVDRLYAVDVGGNVWRVDLQPAKTNLAGVSCLANTAGCTPDIWQVTQLAQLGTNYSQAPWFTWPGTTSPAAWPQVAANVMNAAFGALLFPSVAGAPCGFTGTNTLTCNQGTPRKFFYPAEVLFAGATYNYDALFVGSGDREHPLYSQQAYYVTNRMYMIKDMTTGMDSISQINYISEPQMADCTGTTTNPNTCSTATTGATSPTAYNLLTSAQQGSGYYITLNPGEKVVNAPLAVAGNVYFGTNQPTAPSATSCTANLGIARGYSLNPFTAAYESAVYAGGGLPPSPVGGVVTIGNKTVMFCIGCIESDHKQQTAISPTIPEVEIPIRRYRSYWYIENRR